MFGMFKKSTASDDDGFDYDNVVTHYEGGVISADYVADTLIRPDINKQDYPYHTLHPHGHGKIIYSLDGEVIEQYEGEFEAGQYHGKGILVDRHGEIYEGQFKENLFIASTSQNIIS